MKLLILGHYEIASNYAISMVMNELLECRSAGYDISIMLSDSVDAIEQDSNEFSRLAHYEKKLCDDLYNGVDTLSLHCDGFDTLSKKINKPIAVLSNPNNKRGLKILRELEPDLIISIRYRKILKADAIAIPTQGIINLHSGLLPQYRGVMATFWAMLNGEEAIGSTLHYISDGSIDTGAIIAKSEIRRNFEKTYLENVLSLYPTGCKNIIEAVKKISRKETIQTIQQQEEGAYYSFPKLSDLELFLNKNLSLY